MKYLKRFLETSDKGYSVFDTEGWKKLLPKKLIVVTQNGNWELERPDGEYGMNHATNISGLMNGLQIDYAQNTPSKESGDVNRDGEPDHLVFDINIVKNNDGTQANPDTLKLDVDITYGDSMMVEFTIEKPNRVEVIHYTGIGSLHDPYTYFGFEDESLKELVQFFNSWGYNLSTKDLTFIDKYPDSYIPKKTNETIELKPSGDRFALIVNNSVPQENRFLENVIKYLDFRSIKWKIASTQEEISKCVEDFDLLFAISTGSERSISKGEITGNAKVLESLDIPVLAIGYGMLEIANLHNTEVYNTKSLIHGSYILDECEKHTIFSGIDMETAKFSFSFCEFLKECPTGFSVVAKKGGIPVAFADDDKRIYGVLFHPEDIDYTYKMIDNFVELCGDSVGSDVEQLKDRMKIKGVIESYSEFINKQKYTI